MSPAPIAIDVMWNIPHHFVGGKATITEATECYVLAEPTRENRMGHSIFGLVFETLTLERLMPRNSNLIYMQSYIFF
jgi:hypothetical protein